MTRFNFLLSVCLVAMPFLAKAEAVYSQPLAGSELPVGNLLVWATSTENDVQNFIVEKSTDGVHFEDLGTVKGAGFSKIDRSYRFMDIGASAVKNFYRLREIASDGTASFSDLASVEKKLKNQYSVVSMSRTEIAKDFRVTLDCMIEASLSWSVVDMKNKIVDSGEFTTINGLNDLKIDFQAIPAGAYRIKIALEDEKEEIVVRRIEDEATSRPNVASTKKLPAGTRN